MLWLTSAIESACITDGIWEHFLYYYCHAYLGLSVMKLFNVTHGQSNRLNEWTDLNISYRTFGSAPCSVYKGTITDNQSMLTL